MCTETAFLRQVVSSVRNLVILFLFFRFFFSLRCRPMNSFFGSGRYFFLFYVVVILRVQSEGREGFTAIGSMLITIRLRYIVTVRQKLLS